MTSMKIKREKKQYKKTLPKNVLEIVSESGQIVERVDTNSTKKTVDQLQKVQSKPILSERTKKRRVNIQNTRNSTLLNYLLTLAFKRREWNAMNYEPFDITRGRDYERSLQRIATRGIVQLFNTVRKQQQNSSSSKTTANKKNNSINKGEFLDMLKTIDSDDISCKIMKKSEAVVSKFLQDRNNSLGKNFLFCLFLF